MQIAVEDLSKQDVQDLLHEHLMGMHANSPQGCVQALDLSGLQSPTVTFLTVRGSGELLGCGALKAINEKAGEIKSMRTAAAHLRKGVAAKLLTHILEESKRRGYEHLYLETGSSEAFQPAIWLYERFGFIRCGPFADYEKNDFSIFMNKQL